MKFIQLFLVVITVSILSSCSQSNDKYVMIETEYGNMKAVLYNSTPKHRDNFVKLANEGYYNDLLFHRIIQGFMIQGGDPDSKGAAPGQRLGSGGPGYRVDAEIGEPHLKGCLAAARTGGPSNPNKMSSGSQYYIVHGNKVSEQMIASIGKSKKIQYTPEQIQDYITNGGTPNLDGDYTVFGRVVEGLDVIDKIAALQKDSSDRPLKDVKMKVSAL